ncbi:hypothetical protein [Paenibacillus tyrfis]|uniref:hypothetical protein n=1 Tax=Paenibacillus tyrfis TaxID=1501230 RepID=UPI00209F7FB5|nr:hypothetical protein [Paenibacillus tyrfis]MCP1311701.1 hypothetical protein [Paenibacillus tyrfis]
MKRNKFLLIFFPLLILVCIFIGISTRLSYTDDIQLAGIQDGSSNPQINILSESESSYYDNKIEDLTQLRDQSDVIAIIEPTGKYIQLSYTIQAEVRIKESLKGQLQTNQTINIYQPGFIKNQIYYSVQGYSLFRNNKEYIVFLKYPKYPEGFQKRKEDELKFLFVSSKFGKYSNEPEFQKELLNKKKYDEGSLRFKDSEALSLLTMDVNELQNYNNIKKEVLDWIKSS